MEPESVDAADGSATYSSSGSGGNPHTKIFITTSENFSGGGGLLLNSSSSVITTVTSASTLSTSTENERPPVDFQVASDSSEEDSDSENFDQLMMMTSPSSNSGVFLADQVRCPLCFSWKKRFTCRECLLKGDFYLSNPNKVPPPVLLMEGTSKQSNANPGWKELRYVDLKLEFLRLQHKRIKLISQCEPYAKHKERICSLMDQIEKCKDTIRSQKQLKLTLRTRIMDAKRETDSLLKKTQEQSKFWPVYRSRLNNMQTQFTEESKKLQLFHQKVLQHHHQLKLRTRERILQLKNCVFPIHEIDPQQKSQSFQREIFGSQDSWSDEEDDTVSALMAATSNYWGKPDELVSSFGTCHSIPGPFGPTLPASGDYSAFGLWTERNQGRVTSGGSNARDPSHCIAAALTYTTQFVNLMAFYLDLRLPHRLSYTEFTNGDLAPRFNRKVAKLNANIVHLCASQGIQPTFLQPRKTIPNLLLLFDPEHADLGRRGPFEVSFQLAKSMEDSIEKDLVIFGDGEGDANGDSSSDSDWNDSFPSDWENVQKGALLDEYGLQEMANQQSYLQNQSQVGGVSGESFQRSRVAGMQQQSVSGGLVSSVTSFFRGWRKIKLFGSSGRPRRVRNRRRLN